MRRTVVLCAVVAIVSLISVSQASAIGWRLRKAPCCRPVAVAQAEAAIEQADSPVQVDQAAALSEVVHVMQGMLIRENDRLQWALQYLEECDDSSTYGSD